MEKLSAEKEEFKAILIQLLGICVEIRSHGQFRDVNEHLLLSRKETAKKLCISLPTLHQWTKNGNIQAHRIGGRVLYKWSEIELALKAIEPPKKMMERVFKEIPKRPMHKL